MRRPLLLLALFVPLAVLLAGCATGGPGGKTVKPLPSTIVGTVPTEAQASVPAAYQHGDPVAGKQVFLTAGCTGCHTLADAGSHGTVGPNLDAAKPALSLVYMRVTQGAGAMPSFKGQLSPTQIANVIAYVVKATGGNANG